MLRSEIVGEARTWLGTPYQHQASCKGAGTDCLGLLRGIWREVYGREPELVPAYTQDWSETDRQERLLEAAARHLNETGDAVAGDLLVFRMKSGGVAKHLAIRADAAAGYPSIIHAYSGRGVVETPLTEAWARRIAAAFSFPDRSL